MQPCIVVLSPDVGGTGSVASVVARHCAELAQAFPVILVSRGSPDFNISGINFKPLAVRDFPWLRRYAHVPNELALAVAAKRVLAQLIADYPVGSVICHSHALAALTAWPVKKRHAIPYALVVHADIFDRPVGTYDSRLTRFYKWVTPVAYQHADKIFAISPAMADQARAKGAKPDNISLLPNGIDPCDIGLNLTTDVARPSFDGRRLKLLYVGRLSVDKGVETLLHACLLLHLQGYDFSLSIIGQGPCKQVLQNYVEQHGLSACVEFLGTIPRTSLAPYYQGAHLTCVPSLSEPQGLVVLESLLCGTPVVGSATGGIPMMLKDGVNGTLFPPGDAEQLATAIRRVSRSPAALAKLSASTKASVFPDFNWHTIGTSLINHMQTLMN